MMTETIETGCNTCQLSGVCGKVKKIKVVAGLILILIFVLTLLALKETSGKPQTLCPVMGNPINKEVYFDYKGNRIYFCCPMCIEEFKKDPEKYIKKLKEQGITLEKTPELKKEMKRKEKMEHEHKPKKKRERKKVKKWHCPMHPTYVSDKPGECPICGMNLVPVEEVEEELPPGAMKIPTWREQLIGVRYGKVEKRKLEKMIRTVGYIEYDESRVKSISLKFSGWIEKLYVDWEGKFVKKGQPLFKIYSPELAAAQEDYLIALRAKEKLKGSTLEEARIGSDLLLESAKGRLLLWGLTEKQIKRIEETGKVDTYMEIVSPYSGFVIKKSIFEGQHVMPKDELYKIADISVVWVLIDIYEEEIPLVKIGRKVKITLSYFPGEEFWGRVVYVYPYLEPRTRTVKVRVKVPNPGFKLKPGMYATAEIKIPLGVKLAVSEDAILFSGDKAYVFLKGDGGVIIPKEVKVGHKTGDFYVVLDGVSEGDTVVTSANFLIDSESKLREALKALEHKHE